MRIAMVASWYPYGGAEQVPMSLVEGMEARHEMYFITSGDRDAELKEGGHARVLLAGAKRARFWRHYANPALVRKLRSTLARIRPDVVHFHSIHNRTFSASSLMTSRDYPTVWSLHDFWSVCVWSKPRPPECDGMLRGCRWCRHMPGLSVINRVIKERYWKRADLHLILCNEWMRGYLAASAMGRKPIHVVPNGVDPSRFDRADRARVRASLGIPAGAPVVLFAGNMLLPQKGHRELLHVARRMADRAGDPWFVFVGHHRHGEESTGHPRIVVTGPAKPDEMPDWFAAADVFAFPSHVEFSPLVILEAMASGLPQVTCNVGGTPEQVEEGRTGFLINKGDEAALESRIAMLLDDEALRRSMGRAARERVKQLFTLDRQVRRTEEIYAEVVARRRGSASVAVPALAGAGPEGEAKRRLRIVAVAPRYPWGGAEQVAMDLVEGMSSRHDVTLITAGDEDRDFAEAGHRRIVLGGPRRAMFWHHFWNRRLVGKLRERIEEIAPDVVHLHNLSGRTFSVSSLLLSRERPTVWSLHDVWSLGAYSVPHRGGGKLVNGISRALKERIYRKADLHVIVPCEWLKRRLEGSALASMSVHVIPNGVVIGRFAAARGERVRGRLGIAPEDRVVLFVGGMLDNVKGWEDLLRLARPMVKEDASLRFLFVGRCKGAPPAQERILFAGEAPAREMPDYYAAADVFAYPTHADILPGVVLEAMASGLPVVAHDVGGIPEAVAEGETGFVVARDDAAAFEQRLRSLLDDETLRRSMGRAARERVEQLFTLDRQVAATEAVYEAVIRERREM